MRSDSHRLLCRSAVLTLLLAVASCAKDGNLTEPPVARSFTTPTGLVTTTPPEIFVGAGDIADCSLQNDEATAKLVDNIPGTVFVLGDNVYDNGSSSEYQNCYAPTWGRHKARTKPSPGNHDYNTSGAAGYYNYFGAAAGDPTKGYYSFDLGAWHVIVLNSNISMTVTSAQVAWLKAELAAHSNLCTLAYWHHPLYSSTGGTGSGGVTYSSVRPLVDALYQGGADLMLEGHRHFYERLAPIKPDGTRDDVFGVREIIAGTGGKSGGSVTNAFPTSEARSGVTFGVLKLYLYDDSYAWKFIPIAGQTFTDSGSTACHGVPGGPPPAGGVSAWQSTVSTSPTTITAGGGSNVATITVTAKDASGNPVSGATVALSATGSLNSLTQPAAPTGADGVATGTLSSTVAQAKIVSAIINGVAITQTDTLTVSPDAAAELAFRVQPATAAPGATIQPAVEVDVTDQFDNRVGSTADVTLAIGTNPGGGTLSGTTTVAAQAGVATFRDLSINQTGTGYRLAASASGLTGMTSSAFDITAPTTGAVLVGAGDIARCDKQDDEATAALLDNIAGTVFTVGSAVYVDGSLADFTNCYGPSWGRHRARTRPAVGWKEYVTAGAAGYFQYFGTAVGDSGQYYYSYDLGDWHIIVLNDNWSAVPTAVGSPQEQWLRADLAASTKRCTLAYWQHPRFSSSEASPRSSVQPFWDALYAAGAEVVLNAYDRNYERFAPQTPGEVADPQNGIREFVVGTGGQLHTAFATVRPNSEVRNNTTFGVLKLTLGTDSYSWEFIPGAGGTFTDSGTGTCH